MWSSSPRMLEDDLENCDYYLGDAEGVLQPVSPAEIRAQCVLVSEVFDEGAQVCINCDMRGRTCRETVETPMLVERFGEDVVERAQATYGMSRATLEIVQEGDLPEGFELVTPFEARPEPHEVVPTGGTYRPSKLRLHPDELETRAARHEKAIQKSASTRKRHNEVCGTGDDACLFRSRKCHRWRRGHRWRREGRCSRRWSSDEELAQDVVDNFVEKHGHQYDADMRLTKALSELSFRMISPETGRYRQARYRGFRRTREPYEKDELVYRYEHELFTLTGRDARAEFEGSYEEMVRFLRRWAPLDYEKFIVDPDELEEPTVQEKALMISIAARGYARSKTIVNTTFGSYGMRVRTTAHFYRFRHIGQYAMRWGWPKYATQ